MSDIEELKRRKEELLLKKEIAKLERAEKKNASLRKYSIFIIDIPLGVLAALLFLNDILYGGDGRATTLGIVFAFIIVVRFFLRR